jgi:hypothetical protein
MVGLWQPEFPALEFAVEPFCETVFIQTSISRYFMRWVDGEP